MIQKEFADQLVEKVKHYPGVVGLAAGGSWITGETDEYSDLDLVLVTETKISDDKNKMIKFASAAGDLLGAFTGEHVGELRVLICLYDNPLLHVDIKFVTVEEFKERVENPVVLWEKDGILSGITGRTRAEWPKPDFQWLEDRFWTWIHYASLKVGRGEYFEALDFISYLRVSVISPLMQIRNGQLPRGLRKVEFNFADTDLEKLKRTVPEYEVNSIVESLENVIQLYLELRKELYPGTVVFNEKVKEKTIEFFYEIKKKKQLYERK